MISAPPAKRLWPCLVLAAALPLAASQKSVVMPLAAPAQWKLVSSITLQVQDLVKFGDQLDVDKELGVSQSSERVYARGDIQVKAIFEQAADPSSAYALYTIYEGEDMRPVDGVELAVRNSRFALMTRGRYFIRVIRPENPPLGEASLKSLLIAIGGARLSRENADNLPRPLPSRGLQPGTERYILGPVAMKRALPRFPAALVGFSDGAEVTAGTYLSEGDRILLAEINYPTPELASLWFKNLSRALDVNDASANAPVYAREQGSYVLFVLNARSAAGAHHLLDQFRLHEIVTQVPKYPGRDRFALQLVELIVANGELVMIIIVFAILGGIAIYLTKRLIMKLFPGSGLIRPDDDILIRLKLT